jgi:hypothetical protein
MMPMKMMSRKKRKPELVVSRGGKKRVRDGWLHRG